MATPESAYQRTINEVAETLQCSQHRVLVTGNYKFDGNPITVAVIGAHANQKTPQSLVWIEAGSIIGVVKVASIHAVIHDGHFFVVAGETHHRVPANVFDTVVGYLVHN